MKLKSEVRLVVLLTVCLAILLLVGLSIALQQPLYTTQSSLTTKLNTLPANYWMSARFNNSQGTDLAFFNFAFRYTNQSAGPVLTTFQFGPEYPQSIYLDSAKFTFTTDSPLSWPDIGIRVPGNGFTPTQISRPNLQTVILNYQNMGFYGQGTEDFDIWFGITIVTGAFNTNHSVSLAVDLTGHNPHALLIGQSYTAEAIFQIVAHPNGLLTVS